MSEPSVAVINALSPDLHRGENPRYGRPGRIPGSTNVPALSLIDASDKTFLDAETVSGRLRAAGADAGGETIVYCGGGIAATVDAFLLHQLGHERVAVYDDSMSEWARDESLPIEKD